MDTYTMDRLGVTVDAKAIARGLLHMMDEAGDNEETLIRFGMLPKRWLDMVEKQMDSVIRERFGLLPSGDEHTVIVAPGKASADYHIEDFKVSKVVAEMVHLVCLALYDSVEMVV